MSMKKFSLYSWVVLLIKPCWNSKILVQYFSSIFWLSLAKKVRTLRKFSSISFTTRTENMAIWGKFTINKNMNRADFHIMPYQTRHSYLSLQYPKTKLIWPGKICLCSPDLTKQASEKWEEKKETNTKRFDNLWIISIKNTTELLGTVCS